MTTTSTATLLHPPRVTSYITTKPPHFITVTTHLGPTTFTFHDEMPALEERLRRAKRSYSDMDNNRHGGQNDMAAAVSAPKRNKLVDNDYPDNSSLGQIVIGARIARGAFRHYQQYKREQELAAPNAAKATPSPAKDKLRQFLLQRHNASRSELSASAITKHHRRASIIIVNQNKITKKERVYPKESLLDLANLCMRAQANGQL